MPIRPNHQIKKPKSPRAAAHPEDEPTTPVPKASFRYIMWDTETAQDFDPNTPTMRLEVNCVAARRICSLCQHSPLDSPCSGCDRGDRDVCFLGEDAMDRFCRWLIELKKEMTAW